LTPSVDADNPLGVEPGAPFVETARGNGESPDETGAETELPPVLPVDGPLLEVAEDQIRDLLRAQGSVLHGAVAIEKGSDEWLWLEHELDAIAGPLTRIVNRYDVLRRAAAHGDYLTIAVAAGGYAQRSLSDRGQAQAASAEQAPTQAETGDAEFVYVGPVPTQPPA
jgi:hypothetical protein